MMKNYRVQNSDYFINHYKNPISTASNYIIWWNYSNLTRPAPQKKVAFWKGNPWKFQGNLGWWSIKKQSLPNRVCIEFLLSELWASFCETMKKTCTVGNFEGVEMISPPETIYITYIHIMICMLYVYHFHHCSPSHFFWHGSWKIKIHDKCNSAICAGRLYQHGSSSVWVIGLGWPKKPQLRDGATFFNDTVDGQNPASPRMMIIPLSTRFYTSQVVQDFFHQQYVVPLGSHARQGP